MTELASLLLSEIAGASLRQRTRRKVFDVVRALGGHRDEASRTAAELSDALRWIEADGDRIRLSIAVAERHHSTLLRFSLLWRPQGTGNPSPRPPNLGAPNLGAHALGAHALGAHAAAERGRAGFVVALRGVTPTEASLELARAALLAPSREELYASLEASNQALQLSHTEAQQASRAKAQFLANMSHEIRTPMNAIMGMNRLALGTDLSQRQRGYLEKIETSARHLLGIVDDVLDVSKIEAGKLALEPSELSLVRLLDDVTALAGSACAERGLTWSVVVAPDVPGLVYGDPLRLRQILVNLVGNAVKFTETGGVELRIARGISEGSRVELLFAVADTGIGIRAEQQAHLFSAFTQADATITRKFGGTGLGLAICRSLVEMMDGEISLESEPNVGSTFTFNAFFDLPDSRSAARVLRSDLHGKRVLIADPNPLARDNLRRLLEGMGLAVDEATTAQAALEAAAGTPYALLFVDHSVGLDADGAGGIDVAGRLREAAQQPQAPLFLTTDYGASTAETAADAGRGVLSGVLSKPIDASLLFEGVAAGLGMEGARPRHRTSAAGTEAPAATFESNARVLIVEDNRLNQEVAVELLHSIGLSTVVANDGREALQLLAREAGIDLVLMDVQMPVMDGVAATRAIRSDPRSADLPIIAMTANALASDRELYLAAGMNRVVTKPIDPEDLYDALAEHLHRAPPSSTDPSTPTRFAALDPDPAPAVTEETLRRIPGLDVERGLRFSRGRVDLYLKILSGFLEDQRALPRQLVAALEGGDHDLVARLAHTARGLASGLGAQALASRAEELEHLIREGNGSRDPSALRAAVSALNRAHASLYRGAERVLRR